ncbi:DinB family protein [Deinococcus sp. QL22]|uniref:DinB family protein n=1 Tax=Deinococcus sp. QL22 TaxID=2939437 RepID=UPI002016E40A|nr:DinB family protein [Deinococcus sp. QL22]UQN04995.1 DinB family protein [Deinococcus sp. QL22]
MTVSPRPDQYPIGPIPNLPGHDRATLEAVAARMVEAAQAWRTLLSGLNEAELGQRYRPGSWTVHELAHHAADAHMHGLMRLSYGLAEQPYTIQPMSEQAWLTLPTTDAPVQHALTLLDALNLRWAALLHGTNPSAFDVQIIHPQEGQQTLWRLVAKHDWHLRHHLAHAQIALGSGLAR